MNFQDYKKWFTLIFGPKATKVILDDKNECISKDEKKLQAFFKGYDRIEKCPNFNDKYRIKGCNQCVSRGIIVRQQDAPGFLGKLDEIEYVIIGLEAKLPDDLDIHIAFDQYGKNVEEHPLFTKLKLLSLDIKDKTYVTDIAKCNSNNLDRSRKICFKTHFRTELDMLLQFNPELKIILLGRGVEKYFPKGDFTHKSDNEVKSENTYLFKRGCLRFKNKEIPTVLIPHTSNQNASSWKKIKEPVTLKKITALLKEF